MSAPKKSHSPLAAGHRGRRRQDSGQGFYTPFDDLDQHLAVAQQDREPPAPPMPAPAPGKPGASRAEVDEQRLFEAAMEGIVRFPDDRPRKVPRRRPGCRLPRFLAEEERAVLVHLQQLVRGDGRFELFWSDEHVDGAVVGLSPAVMKRLRRGEFSYQAHLDLHGYTGSEARPLVEDFVLNKQALGLRCLLIICGRGLNSKNRQPVLKEHLVRWFTRSPLKNLVLAFSCARAHDGGAGAFYVLLRRCRGRQPVVTPAL